MAAWLELYPPVVHALARLNCAARLVFNVSDGINFVIKVLNELALEKEFAPIAIPKKQFPRGAVAINNFEFHSSSCWLMVYNWLPLTHAALHAGMQPIWQAGRAAQALHSRCSR